MTPLEIEFDEVFKRKGGRYKNLNAGSDAYSWILANSRILVTWKKQSNIYLPEPYIDIIDNDDPNAYVTKRGDRYFIGITRGTIVLFNDVFYRMLSSKNVLTEVGNPTKGIDETKILSLRLTGMGQLAVVDESFEKSEEIDDTRKLFGLQLVKMAFDFLIWHELAHIFYGHVDYIHSILGAHEVKEIQREEESRTILDPLVSQTLEMSADNFAANQTIVILEMLISTPEALAPGLRPYFNGWPSAFKIWVFSSYTFFRLFSSFNSANGIAKAFYPPPAVRSHLMMAIARSVLQQADNAPSQDDISKICADAILSVERAFAEISQTEIDFAHLTFSVQDEVFAHGSLLVKNWENVKPLLEPFSLLPLTF